MRTGLIVVTESLRDEVLAAVEAVKKPTSIYVSRGMLESELADNPEKYPSLSRASQAFRRQAITKVMKSQYAWWGESAAKKRSTVVWDITQPVKVPV